MMREWRIGSPNLRVVVCAMSLFIVCGCGARKAVYRVRFPATSVKSADPIYMYRVKIGEVVGVNSSATVITVEMRIPSHYAITHACIVDSLADGLEIRRLNFDEELQYFDKNKNSFLDPSERDQMEKRIPDGGFLRTGRSVRGG